LPVIMERVPGKRRVQLGSTVRSANTAMARTPEVIE
jgi:hypothetical protein